MSMKDTLKKVIEIRFDWKMKDYSFEARFNDEWYFDDSEVAVVNKVLAKNNLEIEDCNIVRTYDLEKVKEAIDDHNFDRSWGSHYMPEEYLTLKPL